MFKKNILLLEQPGCDRKLREFLLNMAGYRVFPTQHATECANMITQLNKLELGISALVVRDQQSVTELASFIHLMTEEISIPPIVAIAPEMNIDGDMELHHCNQTELVNVLNRTCFQNTSNEPLHYSI